MAKITEKSRDFFYSKVNQYKENIEKTLRSEKSLLEKLSGEEEEAVAYGKLTLCEYMIHIAALQVLINNLSVEILGTKNTDALNDGRKMLYKAVIYLEEVVSPLIDSPYSEYEDMVMHICNASLEKRYYLIRKLGLAIRLIIDGFGDNTKWKWSFVELQGRYAAVAKNLVDMKQMIRVYFEPNSYNYDLTVYYLRLIKKLLAQSGEKYRDRYELSTHRLDDIRIAINYVLALRRLCILLNDTEEAEELKKKAGVWSDKMESDKKKGISQ